MSVSGIMNYACCCNGGGTITTCPEWVNCRPQEVWLSYSYSANYKEIVLPQSGATGSGGILREETESCSGNVRFIRTSGTVQGCGGLIQNPMEDYLGDFTYSKIVVQNRLIDSADTYGPFCPDACTQCLRIVPQSRTQTNGSGNWNNSGNVSLYGDNAVIRCFRCIGSSGTQGGPRSWATFFQRGNFSVGSTTYRCNGAVQSSGSIVLPNHYAALSAVSRPQCLNASSFADYYIARNVSNCSIPTFTFLSTITYPTCRVLPDECDSNGNPRYYEGDSINDCYQPFCAQRSCYDPFPILVGGCGCSTIIGCDNPFPSGPFNNGCGEFHVQYTMSSSVNVTNVIP